METKLVRIAQIAKVKPKEVFTSLYHHLNEEMFTQVGLKVMKRSAVNEIFPRLAVKRYAFDVELLAVAHLYGLKVVEMPVKIKLVASFKLNEMLHMLVDLLGIAYRLRVIHWYQRQLSKRNSFQNMVSFVLGEH